MTVGIAALLFVLSVPIAVAIASFFRHTLTVLVVLGAIPFGLVVHALGGTTYAVFALALLAVSAAMIHTVVDTFRLLGTAKRTERRSPPSLAERRRSGRRSDRSRIAA
jgi:ABC-type Na+ efflux pump permease subunit